MLQKGLSRGSIDFLRLVWFPLIGNLDHLLIHSRWSRGLQAARPFLRWKVSC